MRSLSFILWPCVFLGQLLATLLIAWHLMAQINFAYPTGYKLLGLEKHIAEYAPLNRYKHGFEFTKPQKHWDLFAQITKAVQHNGEGLEQIFYQLPNGTRVQLMHKAEITHLEDVGHLINKFYLVGILGGALWLFSFILAVNQKIPFPSARKIALGFSSAVFIVTSLIISVGATKVFYWFHTKIFPDGHQWFFYYEDSLMTTLMKAPDIFAFIAALLLVLWLCIWAFTTWCMTRFAYKAPVTAPIPDKAKKYNKKKNAK